MTATPICFAYNHTSWDAEAGKPVSGGMADALVQPILPYLKRSYTLARLPQAGAVNVYYAHRRQYVPREPGVASVFVSHGIADKAWRNAPRLTSAFNWIVVSGPSWTRRLVAGGLRPQRVIEAGYTKLDPIFNGMVPAPERDGRIRVVYAPTHGGGSASKVRPGGPGAGTSSWWNRDDVTGLLPESDFDVVVAPHPRHRPDKRSTLEEYVGADVVIADGGSTIYEAWALDLPVVFPSWLTAVAAIRRHAGTTFEAQIYRDRLGFHAEQPDDLAGLVELAAAHGIGEPEVEFIEGIFPRAYRGRSGRMHAEALNDIANHAPPHHRPRIPYVYFERDGFKATRRVKAVAGSPQAARYARNPEWRSVAP